MVCSATSSNAQFTPPHQTRQDGPVCVVSGVNWTIALNAFRFRISCRPATVLSCRESSSHRRSGRDTDKTVLSCLAWKCELALTAAFFSVGEERSGVSTSITAGRPGQMLSLLAHATLAGEMLWAVFCVFCSFDLYISVQTVCTKY